MMKRLTLTWLLISLVGCGEGKFQTSHVSGKVTVKGSEPFVGGLVRFIPPQGSNRNSREATTDSQGNYTVKFNESASGLEPGEYKVMFSLYKMPDGSEVPDQKGEPDPKHPTQLGAVQYVPVEYERGNASDCQIVVESATRNVFDFDLPELAPQKPSPAKRTRSRK